MTFVDGCHCGGNEVRECESMERKVKGGAKGEGGGCGCELWRVRVMQKGFGSTFVLFEGFKKLPATTFAPQ